MPKVQTYLCCVLVILHSVCARTDRHRRDESSVDYDALNSQIDAFSSSLDAAYTPFDYNNIVSDINSLAGGLTEDGITITSLPNFSSYIQTAQPQKTLATPSVFVSDIIQSRSSYIATHSPQQPGSPPPAASTSFTLSAISTSPASAITSSPLVSTSTTNGIPFVGSSSHSSSPASTESNSHAQSSSNIGSQSGLGVGLSASYSSLSSKPSQLSTTATSTRQILGGQAIGTSQAISTTQQSTPTTSTLPAKGLRLSSPGRWSITMGIMLAGGFVVAIF